MRTRQPFTGFGFLAALGLIAALPGLAFAQVPEPGQGECTLTFEPAALQAGAEAQEIAISLSQALPEGTAIDAVQVPDESGLRIATVEGGGLSLAVDASAANAGEWSVTASAGGAPVCTGVLVVQPGG